MAESESSSSATGNRVASHIGSVVDKYTIVRLLGQGGMGAVYEARHAELARRFAIKFLLPEFAANREVLRRFKNEAKAAGGLEHPNLAAVMDVGQAADGAPYLVMEFLQGEDGAKLLRRQGPLPVRRAVNIILQACRGLAVAHRAGIVHRDIKPENIFISDAGDGSDQIKVLDFGIAKLRTTDASVATGTGASFGTAFYMSPEQARGAGEVDHRSDVWSLGVVLYELLSGRKPFGGGAFLEVIHNILSTEPPSLGELRPDLPPKLVALVHQAIRKEVIERVPSVVAFAERLAPLVSASQSVSASGLAETAPSAPTQGAPVTVPPSRAPTGATGAPRIAVSTEPPKSRRGLAIWVLAGLAVAAALAGFFGTRHPTAPTAGPATSGAAPAPPTVQTPTASPAPAPAPSVPSPAPVAPRATEPSSASAAVLPRSQVAESATSVRTEHRPNKHEHVRFVGNQEPAAVAAPPRPIPPSPPATPKRAPAADSPRGSHPIDIETDNPYGN